MQQAVNPVDGVGIAYRVIGDGPPLVLAHGTALSSAIWRAFGYVKALRDQYQLILPDMRGHGRSDTPYDADSYAMDLVVGDIVAVLDALGHDRAHYLGYSFGGRVGLSLAVSAPNACAPSPSAAAVPVHRPVRSTNCSSLVASMSSTTRA